MNSFLLANGLSCMILAEAPDPTDLKRMNQFYTWCRSPTFCCVHSMFLNRLEGLCLLHRVGHWWCAYLLLMQLFSWEFLLGRGPGLTLECTWSFALRSCGTPPSAFLALWNRIAGLPWNLGVWQYDRRRTYPIIGTYKMTYVKSCGALGRWRLDCLFPCPME